MRSRRSLSRDAGTGSQPGASGRRGRALPRSAPPSCLTTQRRKRVQRLHILAVPRDSALDPALTLSSPRRKGERKDRVSSKAMDAAARSLLRAGSGPKCLRRGAARAAHPMPPATTPVLQLGRSQPVSSHRKKSLPVAQKPPQGRCTKVLSPRRRLQAGASSVQQFCSRKTPLSDTLRAAEGEPTPGSVLRLTALPRRQDLPDDGVHASHLRRVLQDAQRLRQGLPLVRGGQSRPAAGTQ